MGTADVIPGVSGGTMAFILGIYQQLIGAIKSFDRDWLWSLITFNLKAVVSRPHFRFLIPLFSGIIFALLFFTRIVPLPELLYRYPDQVYGLFFGLIGGSSVLLLRNTQNLGIRDFPVIFAGLVPALVIFNLGTITMPDTALYIFLTGCIAISAMLLPGISGSFILLLLNKYAYIFSAIGYFRLSVIVPFAAGMLTGMVIFSRLLSWVMFHYYRQTTLVISGILIASLWLLWPFQLREYVEIDNKLKLVSSSPVFPNEFGASFIISAILILAGFIIIMLMDIMVRNTNKGNQGST